MSSALGLDDDLRRSWSRGHDAPFEETGNSDLQTGIETADPFPNSSSNSTNPFLNGQMDLDTLWRLLEQRHGGRQSDGNVVGLDETKILDDQQAKHSMTTLGEQDGTFVPSLPARILL